MTPVKTKPPTPASSESAADKLAAFRALQEDLIREHQALQKRMREIEEVLSRPLEGLGSAFEAAPARPATAAPAAPKKSVAHPMPLKEAILKVTTKKPLTKQEIVEAVKALGYNFTTATPINSVNVVLYSNRKEFDQLGNTWGPKKGTAKILEKPTEKSK